jgi:hypothetical protein
VCKKQANKHKTKISKRGKKGREEAGREEEEKPRRKRGGGGDPLGGALCSMDYYSTSCEREL